MYQERSVVGRSGQPFTLLGGLSTINNLVVLRRLLIEFRPLRTLEIGMACGGSALTFAASHRDNGFVAQGQHAAIDGFQRHGFDDVGRVQLENAGLDKFVTVHESLSSFALAKMAEAKLRVGLIYIDGSHQFEDVFCDFYFARELLDVGGLMLFDDSADVEVAKVIKFIQINLRQHFEQISVADYRDLSGWQKIKFRVAEKLHKTQLTIFRKLKDGGRAEMPRMRPF